MIEIYKTNLIPFEWICKVFVDKFVDQSFNISDFLNTKLEDYVAQLLTLSAESPLGLAANGLSKYSVGDFAGARNDLLKVFNLQPSWLNCAKFLGIAHMKLHAYFLAELVFKKCKDCDLLLAESLVEQQTSQKIEEGLNLCRDLFGKASQDQQLPILRLISKGLIYSNQFEKAVKSLEKLKSLGADEVHLKLLEVKLLRWQENFEEAREVLEKFVEKSSEIFMELGTIYFHLKKYEESLMETLQATKLEPYNSECFYLLGKIYFSTKDEVRSKKCFEKCLSLNPQNEKAIALLSSMYRRNNEWVSFYQNFNTKI
jgi:superkiller protein 3